MSAPCRHLIVGGGISGLMTAYSLAQNLPRDGSHSVEIFEADRWGGMIESQDTPYGLVEKAANGYLSSPILFQMTGNLQLPSVGTQPEARRRFIRNQSLQQWPLSPLESLHFAFRFAMQFLRRELPPRPGESLLAWGQRNLGPALTEKVLRVAVQGIYATSADDLSASLVLGRFFRPNKKKTRFPGQPRGLRSFQKGMQTLPDSLVQSLRADPRFQFHSRRIDRRDLQRWKEDERVTSIWIATRADQAAELLRDLDPQMSAWLNQVDYQPVLSATLFFEKTPQDPEGFGYLNHPDLRSDTLGVLWNNQIFPNRGNFRSETWILRGKGQAQLLTKTDAEILEVLQQERTAGFPDLHSKLVHSEITRWPVGLPLYSLHLEQIQRHFQNNCGKVRLVGNYVGGIGLTQIAEGIEARVSAFCSTPQERVQKNG